MNEPENKIYVKCRKSYQNVDSMSKRNNLTKTKEGN